MKRLILLLTVMGMVSSPAFAGKKSASNIPDRVHYEDVFQPDSTDLWYGSEIPTLGYEEFFWEIQQLVKSDHSGTAQDSIQFTLWGFRADGWDSLASFAAEPDSATPGLKYPKHGAFGVSDSLWVYEVMQFRARHLSADTGYGGGTVPRYELDFKAKKD